MIGSWRTVAVGLGAAAVGAFAVAAPALADVTVSPSEAPRGGPAELAFQVSDDRAGVYTTQVELDPPDATPIAEIYPMSTDDWAPRVATRQLDRPVELIHGTTTTEVVSAITWIRVADTAPVPGKPVELRVSLGPMPQTDRAAFTVVQTYSDGTVVRWADAPAADGSRPAHPAPVVTLVDQAAGAGHDAPGTGTAASNGDSSTGSTGAGGYGILAAGLLVGLAVGIGLDGWFIVRAVRRNAAGGARSTAAGARSTAAVGARSTAAAGAGSAAAGAPPSTAVAGAK